MHPWILVFSMNLRLFLFSTLRVLLYTTLFGLIALFALVYYVRWQILPDLPSTAHIKEIQMKVPLRVYTSDGLSIAEYGEERRTPLTSEEIPPRLIQAVLAIEDARFYEHHGVDFKGVARAVVNLLKTGRISQGASTVTMQLARNFFLTRDVTVGRKVREIFLAWRIEDELSKEEIMQLYLNKIFLGHRAYGVAAAAQVYYDKKIDELTLAETAMIAGLPKAPSAYNPISNPRRALIRRNYILQRMHELRFISQADYEQAKVQPVTAKRHAFNMDLHAPYIAEIVRKYMLAEYGENAYTHGYRVFTTVRGNLQSTAKQALRKALLDYDRRHGYRGAVSQVILPFPTATDELVTEETIPPAWIEAAKEGLKNRPTVGGLIPAVIVEVGEQSARAVNRAGELLDLPWPGMAWARPYQTSRSMGPKPKTAADILATGNLVYLRQVMPEVKKEKDGEEPGPAAPEWHLAQIPAAEGALVSVDPDDGRILALMGGFDFYNSKFNRVTQALRQPGSNFKPFVYSAALDYGYSPSTEVNDAPFVMRDGAGRLWRPENYNKHSFKGWMPIRSALAASRNLVSIRLMNSVGIPRTLDYVSRFGFVKDRLPANLTLSLGTPEITPLELIRGYAVFANGGFLVEPYLIERIEDTQGHVLWQAQPRRVCRDCEIPLTLPAREIPPEEGEDAKKVEKVEVPLPSATVPRPLGEAEQRDPFALYAPRVITPQNAWLMTSMLQGVIRFGTGAKARKLGRTDLAGKTGTTNDQKDAWFSGYNANVVTSCWVGFDQPASLGRYETGAKAALPMWIDFMREALGDSPSAIHPKPSGVATLRIARGGEEDIQANGGLTEFMREGELSSFEPAPNIPSAPPGTPSGVEAVDDIF